jgi:hypothetical protein
MQTLETDQQQNLTPSGAFQSTFLISQEMMNNSVLQVQGPKQSAECRNKSNYKLTEFVMV